MLDKLARNKVKLFDILEDMRKAFPAYADALGKEFDDDTILVRKAGEAETVDIQAPQHIIVGRISTIAVDTYNEVVLPEGMDASSYEKNKVVLWGHNYLDYLPHGENIWLTPYPRKSPHELRAATKYYQDQERGRDVYSHRAKRRPLGYSIGYIPLKDITPYDDNWDETLEKWQDRFAEYRGGKVSRKGMANPSLITTKWLLLEYSDVVVPANPDAVQIFVEKGFISEEEAPDYTLAAGEEIKDKGVIPFKNLGKAAEDTDWDAPKEVSAAEVSDLKLMCTWFDSGDADNKGAYKLPHHKASGHAAVWRGVAAAMAALLGARGGVDIPSDDRKGVYNHLVKHYTQFDKEPPEFKEYGPEALDIISLSIKYPLYEIPINWDLMDELEPALRSWTDTLSAFQTDGDAEIDVDDIRPEELKDVFIKAIDEIFKEPSGEDENKDGKTNLDDFNLDELPTPEEMMQLKKGKVL